MTGFLGLSRLYHLKLIFSIYLFSCWDSPGASWQKKSLSKLLYCAHPTSLVWITFNVTLRSMEARGWFCFWLIKWIYSVGKAKQSNFSHQKRWLFVLFKLFHIVPYIARHFLNKIRTQFSTTRVEQIKMKSRAK